MSDADPTRIGLISDIHANHVALQTVLDDMAERSVDALVCAGDLVGYGPSPAECIRAIRNRDIPTVEGNHDRAVADGWGYESGDEYACRTLDDEVLGWLASLPREQRLFDGRLKLVHDHPKERDRYTYPADFSPALVEDEAILVLGHTHVQHAAHFDEGVVVNPGSVGQPRDSDPAAAYAVADLTEPSVELHRVPYDVQRVQVKIKNVNAISNRNARRLLEGR